VSLRLYNTMSRTKEVLATLTPGEVRMYVCGVTVYDLSHIGHARSAIVFDVLRRYLLHRGFRVRMVKNFTDVDDRIIRRANDEGLAASVVSERNIAAYRADMTVLGVLAADVEPKATEHVPEMIALIERLLARDVAYVVDGDVYFHIAAFPRYGRLSGKNLDELLAGARVDVDERKRDPRDFALWKAAKPGEPSWPSPWSSGRPGWHIECSAMSMRYLGESFDIHGGGEDLIFPHHECEIAQSEAVTDRPFARYWVHNGLVRLGREKMSKSLGNTLAIRDIVKRHHPDAIRLWLLGTHYRHPMEWSEERVQDSARALERLTRLAGEAGPPQGVLPAEVAALRRRFEEAMDDDLNTPQAIAALFDLGRLLNEWRDRGDMRGPLARGAAELVALGRTLGLLERARPVSGPPPEVQRLVDERTAARTSRDWRRADELRDAILRLGWTVEDTPAGARLTPARG